MSLEQAITENTAALRDLIAALTRSGLVTHGTATVVVDAKDTAKPETAKVVSVISPADAASAITKLANKNRDQAVALLKKFGAAKASEIGDDRRAEFIGECNKLLAAAA